MEELVCSTHCGRLDSRLQRTEVIVAALEVLMKEMAMYYYACKLSSMASCSGRRREGGCGGSGGSGGGGGSSNSAAPSTSSAGYSCCSRYRHKSKHKVKPDPLLGSSSCCTLRLRRVHFPVFSRWIRVTHDSQIVPLIALLPAERVRISTARSPVTAVPAI